MGNGNYSLMDFVEVVNRTTRPLEVTFSGITRVIPPGYVERDGAVVGSSPTEAPGTVMLPAPFAEFAKRQNPAMGTFDPSTANVFTPLIGVKAWGDEIEFVAETDAVEVIDRSLLPDDRTAGTTMKTSAGRRAQRRAQFTDGRLKSPTAIRTDYND